MISHGGSGADVSPVQADIPNTASRSKVLGGMLWCWESPEWECWWPGRDLLCTFPWPGCTGLKLTAVSSAVLPGSHCWDGCGC